MLLENFVISNVMSPENLAEIDWAGFVETM